MATYSRLFSKLGYEFKNIELIELALSHRSVGAKNNERLEFIGDSLVNLFMAEALFKQFHEANEGDLSQMRSQLVKGKTLAEIAREFELGDHLKLGQGEMKSGGFRRESILADTVEAIIGAMYLDSNMDSCKQVVLTWYQSRGGWIGGPKTHQHAKTKLQELLQARKKPLPKYRLVDTQGDDHQQFFTVACDIAGCPSFTGEGSNRRSAEQAAAASALAVLEP
ncbi:MAG: ribonuclease-3 [Pseudohongiellaceae bacterium]